VTALTAGLIASLSFLSCQLHSRHPMLDPRLFTNRSFSAGALTVLVQFFATFGLCFVGMQYLQLVIAQHSWRRRGAAPAAPCEDSATRHAPRIARRVGLRRIAPLGLALTASGLAVTAQVNFNLNYLHLASGLVLFAVGIALAGPSATTAITQSLPESRQGNRRGGE
jgi:hypothetical protein